MLSSIHPLGEAGRGNRYEHTAAAFVVGSTAGGVATGLVAGLLAVAGRAAMASASVGASASAGAGAGAGADAVVAAGSSAGPVVWWLLAGLGVVLAVSVMTGRRLPSVARQVDENWLVEYRGWVYGAGFGFQLGLGVVTYIRSALVWLWLAVMVLVGSVPVAVGLGLVFGLVRGLSILTTRSIRTPDDLIAFHRRLHRGAGRTYRRRLL